MLTWGEIGLACYLWTPLYVNMGGGGDRCGLLFVDPPVC